MEQNNTNIIFKRNKFKLGGEENDKKLFIPKNSFNLSEEDPTEKVKNLFPELPHKDIQNVLERAEYNIEKTIELLNELKQEQYKNSKINKRKIKKRNYLDMIQTTQENPYNKKEKENNIINSNQGKNIIEKNNTKETINYDQIINNMDEARKNNIYQKVDYLLEKFDKMENISELKQLLTEIGFPLVKEDPEKEKIKKAELLKELDEKLKRNQKLKDSILNIYKKHEKTKEEIKKKEDLVEEKSNTLGNLIEVEAEQKIRKEYYENEMKEYENSINNNYLNEPKEGC